MAVTATTIITKLNGENWPVWKFETSVILKGRGLFDIVSGVIVKPEEQPAQVEWLKQDAKAQEVIVTRMEHGPLTHILSCETSHDMWNKLKAVYDKESAVSIHLLQQKFFTAEFNQDSMSDFLSKIEEIRVKLKQAGEEISDKMTITKILMSLPDQYKHFRSAWESAPADKQTLEELTSRLLLEEERAGSEEATTALVSRSNTKLKCSTCDKVGHLKKDCFKNKQCEFCKKHGHIAKYCFFKKKDKNKKKQEDITALVASTYEQSSDCWYMDSGCTHHMCNDQVYFEDYKVLNYTRTVQLGDGAKVKVVGEGNIKLKAFNGKKWSLVELKNVLFVPNLKVNLFSVISALDKKLNMISDNNICKFVKDNITIVIAKREGRMFKMCFNKNEQALSSVTSNENTGVLNSKANSKKTVSNNDCNNDCELFRYHIKLAHQNFAHVKNILIQNGITISCTKNHFCTACIEGKQCRKPHPSSETKTTFPGELIHADVCGPIEETSLGGSRYFLLMKDDFSHFRTVYFLSQKSQVPSKLKTFLTLCQNQGTEVKALRTDNGGEFINGTVKRILEDRGIIHQTCVPYTPTQNGKVEREMRTVMEAARTMLKGKSLQKNLWAEAVNTAVFILNRTGTSSIVKKTPYELWFNKKFDIKSLKAIFGTEVWTHIPKQRRLKLDSKSRRGILVGFGENTKGFKIYYPDRKTFSMEREVLLVPESSPVEDLLVQTEETSDSEIQAPEEESHNDPEEESHNETQVPEELNEDQTEEQQVEETVEEYIETPVSSLDPQTTEGRPQRKIRPPRKLVEDYHCYFAMDSEEPATLEEALSSPQASQWIEAMKAEMTALAENNTWIFVEKPEHKVVIIDTK